MLDLLFRAITFATSAWVIGNGPSTKAHGSDPKVWVCVDSLYAEATETVKALAVLLASSTVSILSRRWIKAEARLRNRSKSVSTRAKVSLTLPWFNTLKKIGRWSESNRSEAVTSERCTFWWITMSRISPFPRGV